jgi:hypothetical protein
MQPYLSLYRRSHDWKRYTDRLIQDVGIATGVVASRAKSAVGRNERCAQGMFRATTAGPEIFENAHSIHHDFHQMTNRVTRWRPSKDINIDRRNTGFSSAFEKVTAVI